MQAMGVSREQALLALERTGGSASAAYLEQLSLVQLHHAPLISLALQYVGGGGHRGPGGEPADGQHGRARTASGGRGDGDAYGRDRYSAYRGLVDMDDPWIALFGPFDDVAQRRVGTDTTGTAGVAKRRRSSNVLGMQISQVGSPSSTSSASPPPGRSPSTGAAPAPTAGGSTSSSPRTVFQQLRRVREGLATQSPPLADVIADALALVPSLPTANPTVYFRLRQCQAVDAIRAGRPEAALKLLRTELGPFFGFSLRIDAPWVDGRA